MAADKKPIIVAGRAYQSIEEMPSEVRRVYDLAVAAQNEADADSIKIVFNGKEYPSLEDMPEDVRKLYVNQQASMETYRDFSVDATTPRAAKITAPPAKRMVQEQPPFLKHYKWQLLTAAVVLIIVIILLIKK